MEGCKIMIYQEVLDYIAARAGTPSLFAPGDQSIWTDPYISSQLLKAHLDPTNDLASRRPETIEQTVAYWLETGLIKPGIKVLDLGCGPGLYAERLAQAGVNVVGWDNSPCALDYARKRAEAAKLPLEYHCRDILKLDYIDTFDVIIQVYGELCVFPDAQRDALLRQIHKALKKNGSFIFDVSTRRLRLRKGLRNCWYVSKGGFWRPGRHLVLEQGFDYPEESVWLDQYIVIDEKNITVYRNWFHDYSLDTLSNVLTATKFIIQHVWNDLTGSEFTADGDWIAVAAQKVN